MIRWDEMNIWWGQRSICQTMKRQKLEKLVTSASEASVGGLSQLHQSFCSTPVWGLSASLDSTQKECKKQGLKMTLISRSCTHATFNPPVWTSACAFGSKKARDMKRDFDNANYLIYFVLLEFWVGILGKKPYWRRKSRLGCSNQRESRFSRILENYFEISLLDLGLEVFQFHFHFSKRVKEKIISLFISQKE